eukprot:6168910-Lingulodinium_polyedra.AAC.1
MPQRAAWPTYAPVAPQPSYGHAGADDYFSRAEFVQIGVPSATGGSRRARTPRGGRAGRR